MTTYAAPAAWPLTVLHIVDVPTVPGHGGQPAGVPDARTVCGLPMEPEDLWQRVGRRRNDHLCRACAANTPAPVQEGIF